jgi:hypothetical protein
MISRSSLGPLFRGFRLGLGRLVTNSALLCVLNEFEFRHNTRKMDDASRISRAIRRVDGKRLTYRESVDNPPYFVPSGPKQADAPFKG